MSDVPQEIEAEYATVRKLGEGGMGTVWLVRHRHLNELRVIKLLRGNLRNNEKLRARFLKEAVLARTLQHPNIGRIDDYRVTSDGEPFIVMEYLQGIDLATVLSNTGPLPISVVAEVVSQAADALQYMHDRGLIHRDVSPDNLLLTLDQNQQPVVKLIDLGVVKDLKDQSFTMDGQFVGKLQYASPEQFRASSDAAEIDHRSDIYSLGIVSFELLSDREPITGTDLASIMQAHLSGKPADFPKALQVPVALQQAIYRCLAKLPEERYQSCAAFAGDVGSYRSSAEALLDLAKRMIPAAPEETETVTDGEPKSRSTRMPSVRPSLVAAVIATAAILAGGAAVFSGALSRPDLRAASSADAAYEVAQEDMGAFFAIVIGNSQYRHLPRLRTPVGDAQAIGDVLAEQYGFRVDVVENGTREEILRALDASRHYLTSQDNILIFYAGHGWLDEVNGTGYWQPVDAAPDNTANWISAVEVTEILSSLPARRALVLADSCYSGALVQPGTGGSRNDNLKLRSRLALSSGELQPVYDSSVNSHSVFAGALLTALQQNEKPIISGSNLYDLLSHGMSSHLAGTTVNQSPQFGTIVDAGDEGGGFFFLRRPAAVSLSSGT